MKIWSKGLDFCLYISFVYFFSHFIYKYEHYFIKKSKKGINENGARFALENFEFNIKLHGFEIHF